MSLEDLAWALKGTDKAFDVQNVDGDWVVTTGKDYTGEEPVPFETSSLVDPEVFDDIDFDAYTVTIDGVDRELRMYDTYGDDFDVLFGPAYKGIPISVVTAVAYSKLYGKEVRYCSDRKEEKDHGADKGSFLGSSLKDGDRVIMIEDVTTSGKSMEETVPKVRGAANVEIVGLMVSLNRMEKGLGGKVSALEEIKEKYGFDAHAIVTMQDVIDHLYNRPYKGEVYIDDTLKKAIDEYYAVYGA